jgi:parallel beta-helix repeat protein
MKRARSRASSDQGDIVLADPLPRQAHALCAGSLPPDHPVAILIRFFTRSSLLVFVLAGAKFAVRTSGRVVAATMLFSLAVAGGLASATHGASTPSATRPPLHGDACPSVTRLDRRVCRYISPEGSDSSAGTFERPWRTIAKAMRALRPGQTAYVRAGVYEERARGECDSSFNAVTWEASGSSTAPITIAGYPGERRRAIIKAKLRLLGDHLRLDGLVVDKNAARNADDECVGEPNITVYGDDIRLSGLEIRNSKMSGIYLSDADRVVIARNWIHDNGTHRELDHGIYFDSGSGGRIIDNIIERNLAYGIQMYPHPNGQLIAHNTVIGSGFGGAVLSGARDITVVNNIFAWNNGPGLRTHGDGCDDCSARSNLIYGNSATYYFPEPLTVVSTIRADPRFVSRARRDYHLRPGSPAIGAAATGYDRSRDFDGRLRGWGPDLGALEYQRHAG